MGMMFGLWFEPEMVNKNSRLYREHSDYAITTPGKIPSEGRNQLVLDLTRADVRDYIVDNVGRVIDEAQADYVKWDFNRHLSDIYSTKVDNQGEFCHRYVLGLYDILRRIFEPRSHILLESCSSGGNRFDLGMMCFSPQIWTSDNTDPAERIKIQGGFSYLYPMSVMGAHVSDAPHQQTLRETPLSTRFNVAAFGAFGYEMDLRFLSHTRLTEIKAQTQFYKQHRATLQYGRFFREDCIKDNKTVWHCVAKDGHEAITLLYQTASKTCESFDWLSVPVPEQAATYRISTRLQRIFVSRFGGLVKHLLPVSLNPHGFILNIADRLYCINDCVETYTACGSVLHSGILLNNQFMGSYYNEHTRLLGDFGSHLYVTERVDEAVN
jgi:alpha-galactosidase